MFHILLFYGISAFVVLLVNEFYILWLHYSVFNFQNQNAFNMPFILLLLEQNTGENRKSEEINYQILHNSPSLQNSDHTLCFQGFLGWVRKWHLQIQVCSSCLSLCCNRTLVFLSFIPSPVRILMRLKDGSLRELICMFSIRIQLNVSLDAV